MSVFSEAINSITSLFGSLGQAIDDVTTSDEERLELRNVLAKLQSDFATKLIQLESQLIASQQTITLAEVNGRWYQRWPRPALMFVCIFILLHNTIIAPYAHLIWPQFPILEMPAQLWTLLSIGVGGFVISRGAEKAVLGWKVNEK